MHISESSIFSQKSQIRVFFPQNAHTYSAITDRNFDHCYKTLCNCVTFVSVSLLYLMAEYLIH